MTQILEKGLSHFCFHGIINLKKKTLRKQVNYTTMRAINQVVLPLNIGYKIPDNDPVVLLSDLCDELNYTKICEKYLRKWRKHSPKTLFKIIVYGYMRKLFSSRAIEEACNRDICFMWLLNDEPTPDHSTITRFMDDKLSSEIEDLFYQLINKLYELGEIKFENLFVDGTKIEANANRYTFVWANAVKKNAEKLYHKIEVFMKILSERYMVEFDTPEEYLSFIGNRIIYLNTVFVSGKGKRKTQLQRDFEQLEEYLGRKHKYKEYFAILDGRKSFSKTDPDATFMRMKEDHMLNGQLKPGYNIQIGVESEYIVGVGLFPKPTDVTTLIPFLERIKRGTGRIIPNIIADAGYESEENYDYLEENGQIPYIKPQNYEIGKTRKYRNDEFRVENLKYNSDTNSYICKNEQELKYIYTQTTKSANGYEIQKDIYRNESCAGCPYREKCHKSKNDYRTIKTSQRFAEKRKESYENIISEKGILLRMNRSIQVEGAFGVLKEDYGFRKFLMRGKEKTETQFFLLSFAFNIQKYHNRLVGNRLGKDLFEKKIA